jgi:hypothetical protein
LNHETYRRHVAKSHRLGFAFHTAGSAGDPLPHEAAGRGRYFSVGQADVVLVKVARHRWPHSLHR